MPHHILSECAKELDRAGGSPASCGSRSSTRKGSILDCIELVKEGRGSAHALMNVQTKEQLDVEYVLNAWATVVDKQHRRGRPGRTFQRRRTWCWAPGARRVPGDPRHRPEGRLRLRHAGLGPRLRAQPVRDHRRHEGRHGVRLLLPGRRLQTTIVSRSPLMRTAGLHHVDEDLRQYVVEMMRLRGMEILEGAAPGGGQRQRADGRVRRCGPARRRRAGHDRDRLRLPRHRRAARRAQASRRAGRRGRTDRGFVKVNQRMQTSCRASTPSATSSARRWSSSRPASGLTAARNIMGEDYEWDCTEYPDFLHTTYEVIWAGLTEAEAARSTTTSSRPDAARRGGLTPRTCRCPAPRAR